MNELASLGIILFFALLAGHLVKIVKVPEVTGYILAGVAVGPSFLGWITHENLASLEVFSEVALGLILFSIGSVFEFTAFRHMARRAVLITVFESLLAGSIVTVGMLAVGQRWDISLLLGAISMETAAATTLMVLRENNATGELTDTLKGLIAINNICCLIGFSLVAAVVDLSIRSSSPDAALGQALYESLYPLVWQMTGSVALGFLIGVLLSYWSSHIEEQGETLILMAGAVLLCVGFSDWLELSPLIASLAVGATMVNLTEHSRKLFNALSRTDPPLYAIFFVIAGADMNIAALPTLGLLGLVYVAGRAAGKLIGTRAGAKYAGASEVVQKFLGLTTLAQAGLAIGLVLVTNQRFPELGAKIATIVLAAVAIFELVGPLATKFALSRSGETRPQSTEPAVLLD